MAAQALIVFTQGPNTDVGGRAVVGTLSDGAVTVTNANNTDVASWAVELLEPPPGSALVPSALGSGVSSTPSAVFTPDVPGSYRVRLTVYGSAGNTDVDIRNFAVPLPNKKIVLPPYQRNPDPLPLPSSGLPTAKPDELNFGGQARGYAGDLDPDRRMLHQVLRDVDDTVGLPALDDAADGDVLVVRVHDFNEPITTAFDGTRLWVLDSNYEATEDPAITALDLERNKSVTRVASSPTTDRFEDVAFDGTNFWVAITATAATDTYLRQFNVENESFGTRNLVHTTAARGIAFGAISGSSFLWVLSADQLTRVVPTTPAGPYVSAALGDAVDLLFDETGSHYGDGLPRVWVLDAGLPGVQRLTGTPAVDDSVTLTDTTVRAIAKTTAGIFVLAIDTAVTQAKIYKLAFNPVSLTTSNASINAVFSVGTGGDVFDLVYEASLNKFFVYGKNAAGQGVIARVNPTTLDVEASAVVASGTLQTGSALPRISVARGSVWVPVMNPSSAGVLHRVHPTTLSVLASPTGFKTAEFDPSAGGGATPSDATPEPIGTASAGDSPDVSRANHIHGIDDNSVAPAKITNFAAPGVLGAVAAGAVVKLSEVGLRQIHSLDNVRIVTHTTGAATDLLTGSSKRNQILSMTGGTTYDIDLDVTSAVEGDEFYLDVDIDPSVSGIGVRVRNGSGGAVILTLGPLLSDRIVHLRALFDGLTWRLYYISDGNVMVGDTGYFPPQITNSGSDPGFGPEKANFDHTHAHGNRSGGTLHSAATTTTNGFQSAADKKKQDDAGDSWKRALSAINLVGVQTFQDLVDSALTDIALAVNTSVYVEVRVSAYKKIVGNIESGTSTLRRAYGGMFRMTAHRDSTTTVTVEMEPSDGATVWLLRNTNDPVGEEIEVQAVAVSGGFKFQVKGPNDTGAGYPGFLTTASSVMNVSAVINVYPVAGVA